MTHKPSAPVQRLDKWLWIARVTKSRTLAAQLIGGGKVRVNRMRTVKPSHALREGDVLTIALRGEVRVLRVLDVGTRRGPSHEARLLYRQVNETDRRSSSGDRNISPDDTTGGNRSHGRP